MSAIGIGLFRKIVVVCAMAVAGLGGLPAWTQARDGLSLDRIPIVISKMSSIRPGVPGSEEEPALVTYSELPEEVVRLLGEDAQDYESFVAARVAAQNLPKLRSLLDDLGLGYSLDLADEIELPFSAFHPREGRATFALPEFEREVPGLFLLQFGYPVRADWLQALAGCGAEVVAPLQNRAFLVKAAGPLSKLTNCPGLDGLVSWSGSYRSGDRINPVLLEGPLAEGEFDLQFVPGLPCSEKLELLPEEVVALDEEGQPLDPTCGGSGSDFLRVRARGEGLKRVVVEDPNLVSVLPAAEAALSDERQGQIVSGHHNGVSVTGPGYKAWLQGRGLLSTVNAQVVATHDSGYDDETSREV